jgi:hypothetical protein
MHDAFQSASPSLGVDKMLWSPALALLRDNTKLIALALTTRSQPKALFGSSRDPDGASIASRYGLASTVLNHRGGFSHPSEPPPCTAYRRGFHFPNSKTRRPHALLQQIALQQLNQATYKTQTFQYP